MSVFERNHLIRAHLTSVNAGSATALAETAKEKKSAPFANKVRFVPVGLETFRVFGPSALQLIDAIASRVRASTGEQGARERLCRRLAAANRRGSHSLPPIRRSVDNIHKYLIY